jgi:predicted XRE-type DNA-binding protein
MGKKRIKGEPALRSEMKKTRAIVLTDTATELLNQRAEELEISRSELIEGLARGEITMFSECKLKAKKLKRSQKLPSAG